MLNKILRLKRRRRNNQIIYFSFLLFQSISASTVLLLLAAPPWRGCRARLKSLQRCMMLASEREAPRNALYSRFWIHHHLFVGWPIAPIAAVYLLLSPGCANITYKGVNYLQQISYSERSARASLVKERTQASFKSYVGTPYEWLNMSSVTNGTLKGLILGEEPLLQSLSGETFLHVGVGSARIVRGRRPRGQRTKRATCGPCAQAKRSSKSTSTAKMMLLYTSTSLFQEC